MHGSQAGETNVQYCEIHSPKHSNLSKSKPLTQRQLKDRLSMNQTVLNSQTRNGSMSSLDEPSISTQYSVDNYPPPMTTLRSRNSETLKSLSEPSSPLRSSRTEEIGRLPGIGQLERPSSHSPIGFKNSPAMENISSTCSQSLTPACTAESSPLIRLSERELGASETSNYPTLRNFPTSKSRTWIRSGYLLSRKAPKTIVDERVGGEKVLRKMSHATIGMTANAVKRKRTAEGYTSVTSAEKEDIKEKNVGSEHITKRPKYWERSVWTDVEASPSFSPTACFTLTDKPLPRPPPEEFTNSDAMSTISDNPDLFRIVTPIKISEFEDLLEGHPNKPFVRSVCTSFREGFWPWANTRKEEYPTTWDFSERPPKTEHEADFLREQRDIEIKAGRYSESFGTDLLPGMYSTPIHAIPKPRSVKLRLVNDHSAGPFSLNSMISREDAIGAKMDSISDLIGSLLRYRKRFPNKSLVLFKSDVSAAYRRLPLHPLWQVKQIVTVDNECHVDRCTSFGGRGSCHDYTAFMGLVLWIAIFVRFITDLFGYIDDNFGFDEDGCVMWYEPYHCYYPSKQAKLLKLWDDIGLPHDKSKQEYGPILRIIGFMVDPKLMRVSMDEEDRTRLLHHVQEFCTTAPGGTRRTLREFQQLAGWINWSFNVFPLLKPALSNVYSKIGGKSESHAKIFVSKAVVRDLDWFASHVRSSNGVYLFEDIDWDVECADVIAYSDASLSGLGFFFERLQQGFQCSIPQNAPKDTIFYFEALAVVSAIDAATRLSSPPTRLLIFSDNTNTVDIFNSLRSLPSYNDLLKYTVSLLLKHSISLRVMHVPGVDNSIADSLSRFENSKAISMCPDLSVSSFQPPRIAMGQEF